MVSERYNISREDQDIYALQSQQRTAAAQNAGLFDDEIVSMNTTMAVFNKETRETSYQAAVVDRDDCNRPGTTLESLTALEPVFKDGQWVKEGRFITAGNSSQLSAGASACVVMDAKLASQKGLAPLGIYRGVAVAGCKSGEMGIGPVFAVPKLLQGAGRSVHALDLC